MLQITDKNLELFKKLSKLEFQVYYYIKYHKIKNNTQLAKLIGTTPNTINVIKYRLVKKGVLTRDEVRERTFRSKSKTTEKKSQEKATKKKHRIKGLGDILGLE
jgi:DNA-binding MarR family transcriptional regulator